MAYTFYNPNPVGRLTNDCTVRAVAKALDVDWDTASVLLCNSAIKMGDIEPSNQVLAAVLRQHGFYRAVIDNTCPDCYTAEDFCNENFKGIYVLGFGDHVCTVVNGVIFDTFDSSKLTPIYYWYQHD